jgi:hypothetical protein
MIVTFAPGPTSLIAKLEPIKPKPPEIFEVINIPGCVVRLKIKEAEPFGFSLFDHQVT